MWNTYIKQSWIQFKFRRNNRKIFRTVTSMILKNVPDVVWTNGQENLLHLLRQQHEINEIWTKLSKWHLLFPQIWQIILYTYAIFVMLYLSRARISYRTKNCFSLGSTRSERERGFEKDGAVSLKIHVIKMTLKAVFNYCERRYDKMASFFPFLCKLLCIDNLL